jgi:hypothetical protein
VGRPLWAVIYSYNCFWALPEQSLSGPSPTELRPYFTVSLETQGPRIYISQEQGAPVIPEALGSLFVASYDSQETNY